MESIIRGLIVYVFLFIVFRIAGKRTLSEATAFDLVLLLIISETTQQAMVDNDHSIPNAVLLILTLVGADVLLSDFKQWLPWLEPVIDGSAVILVRDGEVLARRGSAARRRSCSGYRRASRRERSLPGVSDPPTRVSRATRN